MAPSVSIIVPVYNAKEYINRCVESVLGQEYQDFELILIDDGSSDGSGEICEGFAKSDSRVRVIRKNNTGVSDTRNTGIENNTSFVIAIIIKITAYIKYYFV